MPKGSEELTNARKEEIIDACAALYETVGFKDITIREIGERTSFTRTSIYNYFQTKEEIFLALLQREHESWIAELEDLIRQNARLSVEEFADRLAGTLERRAFFPFLFGVYPYAVPTAKQREAMELAHVDYARYSIYEITRSFVIKMLRPFQTE